VSLRFRAKTRLQSDDGTILVLSAFLLIVLIALVALVVDLTMQSTDRQHLWNSADSAALAGASLLPNGVAAEAEAGDFALANDADLTGGNLLTTFRCLVADRDGNGLPDDGEVPGACDPRPGPSVVGVTNSADWVCDDGVCAAVCIPVDGDICNTIVLETAKTTEYAFAPAIGYEEGSTEILSAACRGTCGGGLTGPVDVVIVIDRSGSMTTADMENAERASLAMLNFFDPAIQRVGLAVLPPSQKLNECQSENPGSPDEWSNGRWLIVPLSDDYKDHPDISVDADADPDLDSTSELVDRIRCIERGGLTDLGSPIRDASDTTTELGDDALWELAFGTLARPDVRKGILFLSDGAANQPADVELPCQFARDQADFARNQGVDVFTIGFGVDSRSATCDRDETGQYAGQPVTKLLADMAKEADDDCTAATTDLENADDDYFFCVPKDEDLATVFLAIAAQLSDGSRLVQLPPGA